MKLKQLTKTIMMITNYKKNIRSLCIIQKYCNIAALRGLAAKVQQSAVKIY